MLMRDGKVLATGPANEVIRTDVLEATYEVKIDLIETPDCEIPLIRAK